MVWITSYMSYFIHIDEIFSGHQRPRLLCLKKGCDCASARPATSNTQLAFLQIQATKNKETPWKWDVFHGHCHPSRPVEASGCWIRLSESARFKEFVGGIFVGFQSTTNDESLGAARPGVGFRVPPSNEGSLTCK